MSIINNFEIDSLSSNLSDEAEELLEFHILKKQLSSFASTSMGREAMLEIKISKNQYEIKKLLKETIEINNLEKENDQKLDFQGVFDIKKKYKNMF